MAHRRSFRGRGISQTQRRKKTWFQLKEFVDASAIPGFVTNFDLSVAASGQPGVGTRTGVVFVSGDGTAGAPLKSTLPEESTILRIRGSLLFPKNVAGATATSIDNSIGFGVIAISDLLTSSFPGPISDADWDGWMFKRGSAVTPVDSAGTILDVKSMRKLESGNAFFIMGETVPGNGSTVTGQFTWQFDVRLLMLLP